MLNNGNTTGILTFPIGTVHFNIPDGEYSDSPNKKIRLLDSVKVCNGRNINTFSAEAHYKWQQSNLEQEISEGTYILIKSKAFSPRYQKNEISDKIPSNIIDSEVGVGTNEVAKKELKALGLSGKFDYAKPVSLIKYLMSMPFSRVSKYIILDFFAGSGTTMHATMQLNKEDGGHRQCILVQGIENDEKTKEDKKIAREVTYERNKRVIQGYTTPKGVQVEGLEHNNLRYYRTKLLPRDRGLTAQRRLMEAATELLCIKHDIYEERTMLGGLTLKPRLARYFAEEGRAGMLIVYRTEAIGRLVEEIKTLPEGGELLVYVFSLSSYAMDADFEEVADRVTLCALPRAIYNAYQKVLPKKGRRQELPPLATSDENTQLTIEEGGEA